MNALTQDSRGQRELAKSPIPPISQSTHCMTEAADTAVEAVGMRGLLLLLYIANLDPFGSVVLDHERALLHRDFRGRGQRA